MSDNQRWWGWGTLDETYDLSNRPRFGPFLGHELRLTGEERGQCAQLEGFDLPESRLSAETRAAMAEIVGPELISTALKDRVSHSVGKSYPDLIRLRLGHLERAPDVVIWPDSEEQLSALIELAVRNRWSIVPYGGGSSVTGGIEAFGENPTMCLDLARLNQVLSIDPASCTVTVQAGISGPDLENRLNAEGFTLGHFPQSFEFSSLGGWIATRAAGQASIHYGKIEDMVQWLRVLTPEGIIETRHVPASAAGPSVKDMLVGSEGAYGIITQATMRIHRVAVASAYRGLLFGSYADGVAAIQTMMQSDQPPSMARISDVDETRSYLALSRASRGPFAKIKQRFGKRMMVSKGIKLNEACLMVLGCEGDNEAVKSCLKRSLQTCAAFGAFGLGRGPGESWVKERFALPYLRDILLDRGVMVDTLETATTWDNLLPLYLKIQAAIGEAIAIEEVRPLVLCHVSHAYRDGASLYYTFLAKQVPGREIAQWELVKRRTTTAIMEGGGTLSHHHGIGFDHLRWLEQEHGPLGVRSLRALKKVFDPYGVMNPGKLLR